MLKQTTLAALSLILLSGAAMAGSTGYDKMRDQAQQQQQQVPASTQAVK